MKFINWIFSIRDRHRHEVIAYEKAGAGKKVFIVFLVALFAVAGLALEQWALSLFTSLNVQNCKDNSILSFAIFILALALILTTADFALLYCTLGIRMFFFGVVSNVAEKIDGQQQTNKARKFLDLLLGFISLALFIAIIAFAFMIFFGILSN